MCVQRINEALSLYLRCKTVSYLSCKHQVQPGEIQLFGTRYSPLKHTYSLDACIPSQGIFESVETPKSEIGGMFEWLSSH